MKDYDRGKDSSLAFPATIQQDKTYLARTLPGLRGFVSCTLLQGEPFEKLLVSGLADRVEWSDHCAYLSTASRLGVNSLHRPPFEILYRHCELYYNAGLPDEASDAVCRVFADDFRELVKRTLP